MDLKFDKSTDAKHKITLESSLVFAEWLTQAAPVGQKVTLQVGTSFVGQGAPIEITFKNGKGKNLGSIKGEVRGNKFAGEFTVPDSAKPGDLIYFEAKISKLGLSGESSRIPVVLPIKITDIKWSKAQANRGTVLNLTAKAENVPDDAPIKLRVYEKGTQGVHEKITELPANVYRNKIDTTWEFDYPFKTKEIPTQTEMDSFGQNYVAPTYFFSVLVGAMEFGNLDPQSLLSFFDFVEFVLTDETGNVIGNQNYTIEFADGSTRDGKINENGYFHEENCPPGPAVVTFKDLDGYVVKLDLPFM